MINKGIVILGIMLLNMGEAPGVVWAAGVVSPGDYTSAAVIVVPNGGTIIGESGTYNINNSDSTLHITNEGTSMHVFGLNDSSSHKNATINGNVDISVKNMVNSGILGCDIDISNANVLVNGDFSYTADNKTINAGIGSLLNVGNSAGDISDTTFHVTGDFTMTNTINKATSAMSLMTVYGTNTVVTIDGNLYLYNRFLESVTSATSGANVLYARNGAKITVNGNKSEIYAISDNTDAITAKSNSAITLNSTTNKVVGNISFIDATGGYTLANGGTVTAVFDGADSYWWGDEQNYVPFWKDSLGFMTGLTTLGTLDFTFQNGAEWFYFGDNTYYTLNVPYFGTQTAPVSRAKYISAITLKDGGIINLQDADIQSKLASVDGLLDVYPGLATIKHDFVTIGDLKGSNGIFKLDLNVNDKTQSDMIYVEGSSNAGQHYIEGTLTPAELESLSETNKLRFATAAASASGVSFAAEKQTFAASLVDYQALIGNETYSVSDAENTTYNAKYGGSGNYGDTGSSALFSGLISTLDETYDGGTNWYIYGVSKTNNPIVDDLRNVTANAYDFALDLDTLNKRQSQTQYIDAKQDGMWVRMKRGSRELDNSASGTYNMYQIGYDKLQEEGTQRLGIAFDYKKGNSSIESNGSMENSKRGFTIYDTVLLGKTKDAYLDIVARYGKVNSKYDLLKDSNTNVHGDYNNNASVLSLEYGKKFKMEKDGFFEPQAQLQWGHLNGAAYSTSNGFDVVTNSTNSLIARMGFRLGKEDNNKNSWYFKANANKEFNGSQNMIMRDQYGNTLFQENDGRGSWYDVGIGGNFALASNCFAYADIEKTFGNDVKGWEYNLGLQWNF